MIFYSKPLTGDEALHEIQSGYYVFCMADKIATFQREWLTNVPLNQKAGVDETINTCFLIFTLKFNRL